MSIKEGRLCLILSLMGRSVLGFSCCWFWSGSSHGKSGLAAEFLDSTRPVPKSSRSKE